MWYPSVAFLEAMERQGFWKLQSRFFKASLIKVFSSTMASHQTAQWQGLCGMLGFWGFAAWDLDELVISVYVPERTVCRFSLFSSHMNGCLLSSDDDDGEGSPLGWSGLTTGHPKGNNDPSELLLVISSAPFVCMKQLTSSPVSPSICSDANPSILRVVLLVLLDPSVLCCSSRSLVAAAVEVGIWPCDPSVLMCCRKSEQQQWQQQHQNPHESDEQQALPHVTWDAKGRRDFKAEKQARLHTQQMFSIEKQNIKCGTPKASNHPSGFFFCFFFLVRW